MNRYPVVDPQVLGELWLAAWQDTWCSIVRPLGRSFQVDLHGTLDHAVCLGIRVQINQHIGLNIAEMIKEYERHST